MILFPSLALLFRLDAARRLGIRRGRGRTRRPRRPRAAARGLRAGLLARPRRVACLIVGVGFLTVADAGWAHAIGVAALFAACCLGFHGGGARAAPRVGCTAMGERDSYPAGTFCWADLGTTEGPDARDFYTALFGWDAEDLPAGDDGVYTMFRKEGRDVAALYEMGADERGQLPAHWSSYVNVEDLDAVAKRAVELGASVVAEPFDVMDSGRMAVLRDPGGAHVHLWQPGRHIGAGRVNETGCMVWNELATPDVAAAVEFYRELLGWEGEIDATRLRRRSARPRGRQRRDPPAAGRRGDRLARLLRHRLGRRRRQAGARRRRGDHRRPDGRHGRADRGRARPARRGPRALRGRRRPVMLLAQPSSR